MPACQLKSVSLHQAYIWPIIRFGLFSHLKILPVFSCVLKWFVIEVRVFMAAERSYINPTQLGALGLVFSKKYSAWKGATQGYIPVSGLEGHGAGKNRTINKGWRKFK